ncbi:hypothetical protein NST21_13555 [Peribacillus sp. FSL K6-1552]|uniref:hypothetical protein n=1 Tax=Peribacillus sp. FSL K6-1552 TaxID=2954514 RepID=UPI0030FC8875
MLEHQFVREDVYKSDKENSMTFAFVVNVYQDKVDKEKIWSCIERNQKPTSKQP